MQRNASTGSENEANPNHHLWKNNGTWFIHYTRYPTPITKERVRHSLGTKSLAEARAKRDAILRGMDGTKALREPRGETALAA